jgi:Phasin protein
MQSLWAFFPAAWFPSSQGQQAAPIQGIEMAFQSLEPLVRATSQSSIEILRLWTRRSQAAVELATQAAQCREPQDLMGLQTHFWQTATQQYTDAARQVVSSWGSVMPMASALATSMGQQSKAAVQKATETARDFMPMPPEAKDNGSQAPSQRPAGGDRDRRSAA